VSPWSSHYSKMLQMKKIQLKKNPAYFWESKEIVCYKYSSIFIQPLYLKFNEMLLKTPRMSKRYCTLLLLIASRHHGATCCWNVENNILNILDKLFNNPSIIGFSAFNRWGFLSFFFLFVLIIYYFLSFVFLLWKSWINCATIYPSLAWTVFLTGAFFSSFFFI
jgi:hypothetical protein